MSCNFIQIVGIIYIAETSYEIRVHTHGNCLLFGILAGILLSALSMSKEAGRLSVEHGIVYIYTGKTTRVH